MSKESNNLIPIRVSENQIILAHPDQIPEIFSLTPLLDDYRDAVKALGKEVAVAKFHKLLEVHLRTLIQEQLGDPFSQTFMYQVQLDESGFHLLDTTYPVEPDVVKRAEKILTHNILKVFLDRFQLEADQIRRLVELLSHDPVLAYPLVQSLAAGATTEQVEFDDGIDQAVVSPWYLMAMPATEVHPGGQSSLNVYRLVLRKGSAQFVVQTKGYLHSITHQVQVKHFLNADQTDNFLPLSEREFMMRIIKLHPDKNQLSPTELLTQLGIEAGDFTLLWRLAMAHQRQHGQDLDIQSAVTAMLTVLEYESKRFDRHQKKRLKYFVEAIANPLLSGQPVPGAEIVEKYEILKKKPDRQAFLGSLLPSIPSLAHRAGSLTMCGLGMAGGSIFTPGQGMQVAHGFGGNLKIDTCSQCPRCHHLSTSTMRCSHCGYGRGESLTNPFHERKAAIAAKKASLTNDRSIIDLLPIHLLPTKETVGVGKLMPFSDQDSISVSDIFTRRAVA